MNLLGPKLVLAAASLVSPVLPGATVVAPTELACPTKFEVLSSRRNTVDSRDSLLGTVQINPSKKRADSEAGILTTPEGRKIPIWIKPLERGEDRKTRNARAKIRELKLQHIRAPRVTTAVYKGQKSIVSEELTGVPIFHFLPWEGGQRLPRSAWEKFKSELKTLHQNGIAHGDLHEGNFFIKKEGNQYVFNIIDWNGRDVHARPTEDVDELIKTDEAALSVYEKKLYPE